MELTTNKSIYLKHVWIKIVLAIMFLGCLFDMEYGYYQLVRFLGMFGFVLLAYWDSKKEDKTLMIIWICLAVLFNPIVKVTLDRSIWNIADIVISVFLFTSILFDVFRKHKK